MPPRPLRLAALGALALALLGCSPTTAGEAAPQASPATAGGGYPLVLENCGETVTLAAPPQRVVLLESAPVTILDALGVLDRVVARAGDFAPEYYSAELTERIEEIPVLSEDLDASGHLELSQEVVIAQEPDLVLGLADGTTRAGLRDAGAEVLVQPTYCGGDVAATSFATLDEQIRRYGEIFDRAAEAEQLVTDLQQRVAVVGETVAGEPERTAAVLYPSAGGGPLYAYGLASMATPQLEAAGLTNVFADVPARVVEISVEELIARDPEVLVLLGQGTLEGLEREVSSLPGAHQLQALEDGVVLTQLFNFTEPPSPLAVDGLERIAAAVAAAEEEP